MALLVMGQQASRLQTLPPPSRRRNRNRLVVRVAAAVAVAQEEPGRTEVGEGVVRDVAQVAVGE